MARTRRYKKIEKNAVFSVGKFFGRGFSLMGQFFASVFKVFDRKLTVMLVPHSQAKPLSFQTNVFALVFGIILVVGMGASFFYFNKKTVGSSMETKWHCVAATVPHGHVPSLQFSHMVPLQSLFNMSLLQSRSIT